MNHSELRDHFAGLAMQAIIGVGEDGVTWEYMCETLGEDQTDNPGGKVLMAMYRRYKAYRAYLYADAMMRERENLD